MSILFDEYSEDFDPNKLTEAQYRTYKASQSEDNLLVNELKEAHKLYTGEAMFGKFRIEVVYEYRRSASRRTLAMINVYRSNRNRALDLDEPIFFCSGQDQSVGCGKVLIGDELAATIEGGGIMKVLWCDTCKSYVNRNLLSSSLFMNNEPKTIAKRVYELFRELNSDADIILTYNKEDLKKGMEDKFGGKLIKARENRERAIYPLYRIIQDSDSSILKKIEDFLNV